MNPESMNLSESSGCLLLLSASFDAHGESVDAVQDRTRRRPHVTILGDPKAKYSAY